MHAYFCISATWVPGIQLGVTSLGSKSVQPAEPSPQPPVSVASRSLAANRFPFVKKAVSRGDACGVFNEGTAILY